MGALAMTAFNSFLLVLAAMITVFAESAVSWPQSWLGTRLDFLPLVVVYAGLRSQASGLAVVIAFGSLGFDALSANPLGVKLIPLAIIGFLVHQYRELVVADDYWVQVLLGLGASLLAPALVWIELVSLGTNPLFGWGTLNQILVQGSVGALAAPLVFHLLDAINRRFSKTAPKECSFRSDREIKRGKL